VADGAQPPTQTADANTRTLRRQGDGQCDGYFANGSIGSHGAASQPHWITPLATVTPGWREVRYDQFWRSAATARRWTVYDGGKGLELIPTETNEILINPPAISSRATPGTPPTAGSMTSSW